MSLINNNVNDDGMKQHEYQQSVLTMQKSVTITVTPQRSNSLDYLNFEEKRQLIASSLSLSDILQVGPAVAQAAKDVAAASSVIGTAMLLCINDVVHHTRLSHVGHLIDSTKHHLLTTIIEIALIDCCFSSFISQSNEKLSS